MRLSAALRLWALLLATAAWLWAGSVYTPWAADRAPRLWLYDLLFYLRFALLFWAGAEALRLGLRRGPAAAAWPLAATALVVLVALGLGHSEAGLRWKLAASHDALAAAARDAGSDRRRRAGHFLVDSVRMPCPGQPWLWLGRPHGGGSGINLALVHAGTRAPAVPAQLREAFAFWPAHAGWWLAYQHADRYSRATAAAPAAPAADACVPGAVLTRHRHGLALVAAGRRALARR
ncbi:hypothetical protein [Cognatiluteimonas weifangensis]|uniref:Uncharacterized protein n=1 Tax=Cognatiluteimonas weifangensis TaxID=2303539 RepID=A0A372DRC7_9GAMM|nr:hypothetical protein [Luteimonas weifangensis]RFP61842.1 hypothetical protein D0Y53_01910 [Luteimonas weifangensis]